ncbi:MAG: TraR/DksA C4-type zinc finger protein [Gracilimonas sp.]|uniref:TraR/DksA family transcriptional regulator n=1 Tax=Gracilimonas sp. TaxID=1974203 RepID=UPI0019919290|nr:TraR/DksA C4-type zinc finger protein [Gracilimonas sp.]MBD3617565.1 TraR/DksA C4-type zinc finger protein [Gracilimonas sp.]
MTDVEKKKLIKIITSRIEEVKEEIQELKELVKPIPLDASIGRVSRMDAINNKTINESSLREKTQQLKKLERALENSESGNFGICTKCASEIPFGRLEYMPHTTRCVNCVG